MPSRKRGYFLWPTFKEKRVGSIRERHCRCWVLKWRASGAMRGARHCAARAGESRHQQPRRWQAVRPHAVRLRRKDGYVPLSRAADAQSQPTLTQGPLRHVRSRGASVRRVCDEAALHEHIAALDHAPSARRHAAEDEPPSYPETHATTTVYGRAAVRGVEIRDLRISPLPAEGTCRRTGGNQPRYPGL